MEGTGFMGRVSRMVVPRPGAESISIACGGPAARMRSRTECSPKPVPPGAREPLFEWINDCANALVEAIIAITSVIDIEAIVLDSILPRPIHLELLARVQSQFNRISAIGIVPPEIVSGQFGPEASPIGAAMLPFSALLAPDSSVLMIGKAKTKLLGSLSALASSGSSVSLLD